MRIAPYTTLMQPGLLISQTEVHNALEITRNNICRHTISLHISGEQQRIVSFLQTMTRSWFTQVNGRTCAISNYNTDTLSASGDTQAIIFACSTCESSCNRFGSRYTTTFKLNFKILRLGGSLAFIGLQYSIGDQAQLYNLVDRV